MENKHKLIAGLALAGLLGVTVSIADEIVVTERVEAAAKELANVSPVKIDRGVVKEANANAIKGAVEAVLADSKLDLDIRLIGPTSVKVAGDR